MAKNDERLGFDPLSWMQVPDKNELEAENLEDSGDDKPRKASMKSTADTV